MDARGGRPVGFHGHGSKAPFGDQSTGDLRPDRIELVRPVGRLPEQHDASVTDEIDQVVDRVDLIAYATHGGWLPVVPRRRPGR